MSEEAKKGPAGLDRQSSNSLDIPSRTVLIKDASELPSSYCMTPGGTMYSTTPGGIVIFYLFCTGRDRSNCVGDVDIILCTNSLCFDVKNIRELQIFV